uniref:CDP-alcohol phosphatidyltransferase n=1 Tax=Caulobacter sp. (strain K31) TaxID=366602 RepID=B0T2J0_CAUSK
MTSAERLSRIYRRLGLTEGAVATGQVVVVDAGWVFDESLIKALAGRPGVALVDEAGRVVAVNAPAAQAKAVAAAFDAERDPTAAAPGLTRLTSLELGSAYNSALRKREPPVLERLTPQTRVAVEKRLFQGSYKGVTDLVTKYVWPTPARIVTRWCALAKMTPNQVTLIGFIMVLAAFWLFWTGQFGWGLVCAWIMTFLDTVDGKLARVTLTSSKWGNVFDHGIDLVHPPFWWWAWYVGVGAALANGGLSMPHGGLALAIIVGGYVAQRVEEGVFLALFKVEMHAWRPFDSAFRLITARRNPNLIMLTLAVMAGRPDIGFLAVAVWTAICLVVHAVQILQALATSKGAVVSWLSR